MQVRAEIDGREVVASGTLVQDKDNKVLSLIVENLRMEITFVESDAEPSITTEVTSPTSVLFALKGFDNPLGASVVMPAIFTVGGQNLDLALFVHGVSGPRSISRLVSYTIFHSEKVAA